MAVTGRGEARLRAFSAEPGDPESPLAIVGSAADHDRVTAAVETTLKRFGRLDTVVADAGSATHDTVAEGDPASWTEMVLTNVLGPALLIRTSIDALKETWAGSSWAAASPGSCPPRGTSTAPPWGTARSNEAESGGGWSPASPRTPGGRSPRGASA